MTDPVIQEPTSPQAAEQPNAASAQPQTVNPQAAEPPQAELAQSWPVEQPKTAPIQPPATEQGQEISAQLQKTAAAAQAFPPQASADSAMPNRGGELQLQAPTPGAVAFAAPPAAPQGAQMPVPRKGLSTGAIVGIVLGAVAVFLVAAVAASAAFLAAFGKAEPKDFVKDGLHITLTDDFTATEMEGFTACYSADDAVVLVLKEPFTLADGFENYTVTQYGELVIQKSNYSSQTKLEQQDGLNYFEYRYKNEQNQQEYHYIATLFKSKDAFWLVQFAVLQDDFEEQRPQLMQWAKSVSFEE